MLLAEVGLIVRGAGPRGEQIVVLEEGINAAKSQAEEDAAGERTAAFACEQDVGAGGSFWILEGFVLLHD